MVDIEEVLERAVRPRDLDLGQVAVRARRRTVRRRALVASSAAVVVALVAGALVLRDGGPGREQIRVGQAPGLLGELSSTTGPLGSWRTAATPPFDPRSGAVAGTTSDGRVVVWGGRAPGIQDREGGLVLRDGGVYDAAADRWRAITPPPLEGVTYHWAQLVDDRLLVLGNGAPEDAVRGAVLDLADDDGPLDVWTWTPVEPDEVTPAWPDAVTWDGDTLVVMKARGEDGARPTRGPSLVRWSLEDRTWREGAVPPLTPRVGPAVAFDGTRLFVFGGDEPLDVDGDPVARSLDDGAVYDVPSDSWAPVVPPPVELSRPTAGWVGDGFAVVGTSFDPETAVQSPSGAAVYDPDDGSWREGEPPPDSGFVGIRPASMPRPASSAGQGEVVPVVAGLAGPTPGPREAHWFDHEAGVWRTAPNDDLFPFSGSLLSTSRTTDNPGDGRFAASVLLPDGTWRSAAEAPFGNRMEAAVAITGEHVVVVGGEEGSGLAMQGDAWVLDLRP